MYTNGALEDVLEAIKQKAKDLGLRVVQGPRYFVRRGAGPHVNWQGDWADYLALAAQSQTPFLYMEAATFDLEGQNLTHIGIFKIPEAEDENSQEEEVEDEEQEWTLQRLTEATDAWRIHDGQIALLHCAWFVDGIGHYMLLEAKWLGEYREAVDGAEAEAEAVQEEARRIRTKEEAGKHLQLAKQLARHPRFPEATNDDKRLYMGAQLFRDIDEYELRHVVSLAQAVYWWEVEPGMRATKAQQARDLRARGESIKNIAVLLRMSEARVRAALDEEADGQQAAFKVD